MATSISNQELIGYYRQYVDGIAWENRTYPEHIKMSPVPFIDWCLGFMKRYGFQKEPTHINFCVCSVTCGANHRVISEFALCEFPTANESCNYLRKV